MIRVLHYIGTLERGGSQSFIMEIYRKINRTEVQFDFVVFSGCQRELGDEIESLGGRIFESPKYNGKNHFAYAGWWNRFLYEHPEYRVVHGHVRSVASIYLPVIKKHGRYAVLHSHSTSNGNGFLAVIKYLLQLPVRYQADYYFACSDDAGQWLFGRKILHSNKYRTIPNAIDTQRFAFREDIRKEIRKRCRLSGKFVIGHTGRFIKAKNHMFLLEVLAEVLKKEPDTVLLLVGSGSLQTEIKKKCRSMQLLEHVLFAGNRKDTENFYQAMDVFVFPSLWEGLGIAAVEAQTSGLFCLLSEGVPKAADIGASLAEWARLEEGAAAWAKRLLKHKGSVRKSCLEEAKLAGYEIGDSVSKMEQFYKKAARKAGGDKNVPVKTG